MGLFNSDKAMQDAKNNPEKALKMVRTLIGNKKMQADIQEMISAHLDMRENPIACLIAEKVGLYGVEVGLTYNEWLDAITTGYIAPYIQPEHLKRMNGEEIYAMLMLDGNEKGIHIANKLSLYCSENNLPLDECLKALSHSQDEWISLEELLTMNSKEIYEMVMQTEELSN